MIESPRVISAPALTKYAPATTTIAAAIAFMEFLKIEVIRSIRDYLACARPTQQRTTI
jgi:hypothetical protein